MKVKEEEKKGEEEEKEKAKRTDAAFSVIFVTRDVDRHKIVHT